MKVEPRNALYYILLHHADGNGQTDATWNGKLISSRNPLMTVARVLLDRSDLPARYIPAAETPVAIIKATDTRPSKERYLTTLGEMVAHRIDGLGVVLPFVKRTPRTKQEAVT